MKRLLLSLASLTTIASARGGVSASATVRLEHLQGREPISSRASMKPVLDLSGGPFRLHGEGLLEADALDKIPYADKQRARFLPQEGYLDIDLSPLLLRLGMQALRWSESWSIPSLDFWTARRWDRYFFDPLADQLKHPIGGLMRYSSPELEFEAFASVLTPEDSYPYGLNQKTEEWKWRAPDAGGRIRARLDGWDFSPAYAYVRGKHNYGFSINMALDNVVPKLEVGADDTKAFFIVAGVDVFIDQWTLTPQVTVYRASPEADTDRSFYLPLRYESGRNLVEYQMLSSESGDVFWGAEYTRSFNDIVSASVFLQDYQGLGNGLVSSFNTVVDSGWIGGLRLKATR
jgi:hypothetical protein